MHAIHLRRHALAALTLSAVLAIPAVAAGARPLSYTFEVDVSGYVPVLSAACGFDVYGHQVGTAHVLLFLAADGTTIVREMDWNTGWTVTFSAPSLGTSVTQRQAGPLITTYPEGTDVGDPVTAMLVGTGGRIGDDPAEAGRRVVLGEVLFVDPSTGIPVVDLFNVVSASGHFIGGNTARRCAALAG
jgi:hypothetical protein